MAASPSTLPPPPLTEVSPGFFVSIPRFRFRSTKRNTHCDRYESKDESLVDLLSGEDFARTELDELE